ncbi:hypothetical protein COLO4_32112 [Corchorus olitorius]|uniref:Uncharacterized protein n=1 Tax=Corchorus olitorius TaxID=93759 RepID=A0A1R3H188_9ROSI|nr:hypothetical protein COLO4_32112 [Corchorus olitorius]
MDKANSISAPRSPSPPLPRPPTTTNRGSKLATLLQPSKPNPKETSESDAEAKPKQRDFKPVGIHHDG